jgi:hypothetical protein
MFGCPRNRVNFRAFENQFPRVVAIDDDGAFEGDQA